MDRRTFTQSLAAMFALPAVPALPAAAPVAVTNVPAQARFWAIYMHGLHGTCSAKTLQTMLKIPIPEAQGYLNTLVADGVIKPSPFQALAQKPAPKATTAEVSEPQTDLLKVDAADEEHEVEQDLALDADDETEHTEGALDDEDTPDADPVQQTV